jgi:hypothetical protein
MAPPPAPESTPTEIRPLARRTAVGHSRIAAVLLAVSLTVNLTACDPMQMKTLLKFARLKYEPPARLAVIVKRGMSKILWARRDREVRQLLRQYGPTWNWRLAVCSWVPGTAMFCRYAQHVEDRFLSDARTRGDLREALNDAHHRRGCFTWSYTVPSSTNYTSRSRHNSRCRA